MSCKKHTGSKNSSVRRTKQFPHQIIVLIKFKMDKIANTFLLAEENYMSELYLRELAFT